MIDKYQSAIDGYDQAKLNQEKRSLSVLASPERNKILDFKHSPSKLNKHLKEFGKDNILRLKNIKQKSVISAKSPFKGSPAKR